MSERDVTRLLERVAAHTPSLDVAVPEVVAVGRRRVRRRRLVGGSMTIAALAGAVWLGAGPGAGLLGTSEISPASVSWEVGEETTVTLLDGVERGGDVAPLTVTKGPDGASATFVVGGQEETVAGQTMEGGADLFVGERATVMVWVTPPRGTGTVVVPVPARGWSSGPVEADGERLTYWYTTESPGYVPEDILFHRGDQVWSASGQVAETVALRDGDVAITGFELPSVGVVGYVDGETVDVVDTSVGVGGRLTVARLPQEAAFARQVLLLPGGEPSDTAAGRVVDTGVLPSAALAVFEWADGDDLRGAFGVQWSADGVTWHDLEAPGD